MFLFVGDLRWIFIAIAAGVAGFFIAVICTASIMKGCARSRKFKKTRKSHRKSHRKSDRMSESSIRKSDIKKYDDDSYYDDSDTEGPNVQY